MCVAVVVTGKSPTLEDLKKMEDDNPHGGGIAYIADGGVAYLKNLSATQISSYIEHLPRPLLIHFRWATHGGIKPYLTHPFPIGKLSKKLSGVADSVLIHNGTWSGYKNWLSDPKQESKWSDTAIAAYVAGSAPDVLDEVKWSTAVGRAVEGRMEVDMRGDWELYNGVLYSNLTWKRTFYGYGKGVYSLGDDDESTEREYKKWLKDVSIRNRQ